MTGYIYTSSSFLLHIHRGFALLLLHGLPRFRSFNALYRLTNSHGGPPVNMLLSRRTEHSCPILQRARLPRCRSCILLLGVALHPPFPDKGALPGRAPPPSSMFFSTGSSCPGLQRAIQPCSGHDVLLPATSWPHRCFSPRGRCVRGSNALFSHAPVMMFFSPQHLGLIDVFLHGAVVSGAPMRSSAMLLVIM